MKSCFYRLSPILGVAIVLVGCSEIAAQADVVSFDPIGSTLVTTKSPKPKGVRTDAMSLRSPSSQLNVTSRTLDVSSTTLEHPNVIAQDSTEPTPQIPASVTAEDTVALPAPYSTPGQSVLTAPQPAICSTLSPAPVAQAPITETLGRPTRSGPSYVGVGGNIGLGDGDTALGEGSFAVLSKIGILPYLSVRPSVLVSDSLTILLPVTFDFIPGITPVVEGGTERIGFRVSPFIGAGIAISTGSDSNVDFLATGGVDIPFAQRFTATASVNVSLFDNPAVGLLLGVGYNF